MTTDEAVKVLLACGTVEDTYYTQSPVRYLLTAFPDVDWEAAAQVADETVDLFRGRFCSLVDEVEEARDYFIYEIPLTPA